MRLFSSLLLLALPCWCLAWTSPSVPQYRTSMTRLYNVPPPSADDPVALKKASDRETPPASFYELQINCARATQLAMKDGHQLLEIEFPPLPAAVMEMDDVSAYEVANANLELAIDFAKNLCQDGKKVAILLPDSAELDIAIEKTGTSQPYPSLQLSSLRKPENEQEQQPDNAFLKLFGGATGGVVEAMPDIDVYVCIVASAQELPDIEELHKLDPSKTIVFFNLKLDVLRGDLGAPAFPSKDFQDRFLSKVKPVYYLRTRQYSRSTPNPPFMVNYQGCLFRSYPGEFQTLLDTGTGSYRRIQGDTVRPALGEFKEILTDALKQEGVLPEESQALNFLRTGYKTTTWWEDERENASDAWKT